MSRKSRENLPRVNFFDGQRVTESDLDTEQIHHRNLASNIILDFHQNGVVRDSIFESKVLFDTSSPGTYSEDTNDSESKISVGRFDGTAILFDSQPSDTVYGNRLEVTASDLDIGGRLKAKVLILGLRYSSTKTQGELITELVDFDLNQTKITKNYFTKVIAVFFNNFSGGVGKSEYSASLDSIQTNSNGGKIVFRESEPLRVHARTDTFSQIESPNYDLASFITSSTSLSIEEELKLALGTSYSFNELYFELSSSKDLLFEPNADQTIQYGQKFLAKTNNIQKLDLLFYVKRDDSAAVGSEYNFSGEIVVSIHKLLDNISCITDPNPENLLDFDPELSPIIEVSYSQEDIEDMGVKLDGNPQVVSIDLSTTLIADPNIEPSLQSDKFYAVLVSRRGNNSVGTLGIPAGYYKPSRKTDNGQDLNPEERFGRQDSRLIEYDPSNSSYVDYPDLSMWIVVHSDTIEITDGQAYTTDGFPITVPKTVEYVGSTRVPFFIKDIPLSTVVEGEKNYIVLYREDEFVSPSTHPRTGNFVHTKIKDAPSIGVLTQSELDEELSEFPLILSRVIDTNVRDAQDISGVADKPGLLGRDHALFVDPGTDLLNENLLGRVFTPDLDCECNSRYKITRVECSVLKLGDLNDDGAYTADDIDALLALVGNTLGAQTTERRILGGEIDLVDFIQSDLNNDGTVDGEDIELLEDAVDGYVNFEAEESIKVLKVTLENILDDNNYPEIFDSSDYTATALSGSTDSATNSVQFLVSKEEEGLAVRLGDKVVVSSPSSDAGEYYVSSKVFDADLLEVTLSVEDSGGTAISFNGSSGFNVTISSGTAVNMFADNLNLVKTPYVSKNWSIIYSNVFHKESQIDACDLRRFVETNLIEERADTCICATEVCIQPDVCGPKLKNQKILPNDLFIPSGEIYSEPGVPYHGDIEYSTISIAMPPGTIEDCQIDLYNNFVKSYAGSCKTASGYPAMLYSDGTYVGCEDSGSNTDITKGRVKITQCIASLHVDAFIDGYAVDGYADEESTSLVDEIITESFVDYTFPTSVGFSDWPITDPSSGTYFAVTTAASANSPATFLLETTAAPDRTAAIDYPSALDPMSGSFVIDFVASRSTWSSSGLTAGEVTFFGQVEIVNSDGTTCNLKIGWRATAGNSTEMFYSGSLTNTSTGAVLNDFDRSIVAKDDLGDEITFRLRRTNEAVFGMYYDETLLDEDSIDGKFSKIGSAPSFSPGAGDASLAFKMSQRLTPNTGQVFYGKIHDATVRYNLIPQDATGNNFIEISRDSSTNAINRATVGFPITLNRRTNIVSASMTFTLSSDYSGTDSFNLIPLEVINSDNLGVIIDYPQTINNSIVKTFSPGTISAGSELTVDVTGMAVYLLSRSGHLPGFSKAVVVEPSADANSELYIDGDIKFVIAYEDISTGVIFKVGASIDSETGIVSFSTRNILYDALNKANRTVLSFGVHLKKSGFRNEDVYVGIKDLERLGIGTCKDETVIGDEDLCFFVAGNTATGTFVEGPFPCNFHLP